MTDERLEQLRDLARGALNSCEDNADEMAELLAEVDRLRARYEPPAVRHVPAFGGGTCDRQTGALRVTLAAWVQHGPAWAGLVKRVELTDRRADDNDNEDEQSRRKEILWAVGGQRCWELPGAIFRHLAGGDLLLPEPGSLHQHPGNRVYASTQAALDDLSAACLAWAREQPSP